MFAVCVECKNHISETENTNLWGHFCGARERTKLRDPITGEWKYGGKNDLGHIYTTDDRYAYCCRINLTGECEFYQPKTEVKVG